MYSFTENLAYDPIRSSIGSIWTKDAGDVVRFANSFSNLQTGAEKFDKLQGKTDKEMKSWWDKMAFPQDTNTYRK